MNIMKQVAAAALVVAVSGCSTAAYKTTGTIELVREGREPMTAEFLVQEQREASYALFTACASTFILVGGACWLYLLGPGEDERHDVEVTNSTRLHEYASCGRVVTIKTRFLGWYWQSLQGTQIEHDHKIYDAATLQAVCDDAAVVVEPGPDVAAPAPTTTAAPVPVEPRKKEPVDLEALRADPSTCATGRICHEAGYFFELGRGVERDFAVARQLYERSCTFEYAKGCVNLGVLLASGNLGARDNPRAMALYRQACALDPRTGCEDVAARLFLGVGSPVDLEGAELFATRGCKEGHSIDACRWLARTYAKQEKSAAAEVLFREVCDRDDGDGCKDLGDFLVANNEGMPAILAYRKAVPLLERDCARGHPIACTALADIHDHGLGVPVSKEKADAARAAACAVSARYCKR